MCLAIGHPVLFLKGLPSLLNLEGLRPSDYRALTRKEIRKLKELVDLM